jgi:hypothetical protein
MKNSKVSSHFQSNHSYILHLTIANDLFLASIALVHSWTTKLDPNHVQLNIGSAVIMGFTERVTTPVSWAKSKPESPVTKLHEAESLRSQLSLSWSRIPPPPVKLEGSLPCSQKPDTGPYPQSYESSPHLPTHFPKIHSNNNFPSTPTSSECVSSLQVFRSKTIYKFLISPMRATIPDHFILDLITLREVNA